MHINIIKLSKHSNGGEGIEIENQATISRIFYYEKYKWSK